MSNQQTTANFVNSGVRQLIDITFTQAFLILTTLSFFIIFIINNQVFEFINAVLEFIGILYAKQLLYYLGVLVIGFLLSFVTRDRDFLTAGLVLPIVYFILDFLFIASNYADFSLLA